MRRAGKSNMHGGNICGHYSDGYGSGVYVADGKFNMHGGKMTKKIRLDADGNEIR